MLVEQTTAYFTFDIPAVTWDSSNERSALPLRYGKNVGSPVASRATTL